MLHNVPAELKALRQWVLAGPEKEPINPHTGGRANVNDPATWGSYEEAYRAARGGRLGFVISANDPYCLIDIDNKLTNPATEAQQARQQKVLEAFNSYTERSVSGRGYHIIIRGKIPH